MIQYAFPDQPEFSDTITFPIVLEYTWKHLPTGMTGIRHVALRNISDAISIFKKWNNEKPLTWEYRTDMKNKRQA